MERHVPPDRHTRYLQKGERRKVPPEGGAGRSVPAFAMFRDRDFLPQIFMQKVSFKKSMTVRWGFAVLVWIIILSAMVYVLCRFVQTGAENTATVLRIADALYAIFFCILGFICAVRVLEALIKADSSYREYNDISAKTGDSRGEQLLAEKSRDFSKKMKINISVKKNGMGEYAILMDDHVYAICDDIEEANLAMDELKENLGRYRAIRVALFEDTTDIRVALQIEAFLNKNTGKVLGLYQTDSGVAVIYAPQDREERVDTVASPFGSEPYGSEEKRFN